MVTEEKIIRNNMENYKLNTGIGDSFSKTSETAKQIASELANKTEFVRAIEPTAALPIVEFDFNGVKCLVDANTNLEWLYRDYCNSSTMGWKIVGSKCLMNYNKKTQAKLERLTKANELKAAKQAEAYRKKELEKKELLNSKINGVELNLKDVEGWNKCREVNVDPYGKASLDYAESWAKLMQIEIADGNDLKDIAKKTSFEADVDGITGFMYGSAVNILSQCWLHGDELRKWHNKKYNHEGDGVVNPAILSIEKLS